MTFQILSARARGRGMLVIHLVNQLGQTVRTLLDRSEEAGSHLLDIATAGLESGSYFVVLRDARQSTAIPIFINNDRH